MVNKLPRLEWVLAKEPDYRQVDDLSKQTGLPKIIVKILINRGLDDRDKIEGFINPKMEDLSDPFKLSGMDKAVERIVDALRKNERIMVYGDYDVDGVTASSLMFLVLNKLGAQVIYYLPNRLVEGYGLSEDGIHEAEKRGVSLIVSVDTGVTATQEVEFARASGIDVVITDHHEPGETLPNSVAIVNPKVDRDSENGHELAGVGVAFKVAQALYRRLQQNEEELEEHLDLVALGTSADIVPLVHENRILTKYGIRQIVRTTKPGLKKLVFVSGLMGKEISTGQVVFVLAPRINAIGRLGDAVKAIKLLTTRDEVAAAEIARFLDDENRRRKAIDEKTLNEALSLIERTVDLERDKAIVLESSGWHQGVIGIVASRLVERYYLPTVLISIDGGVGKGSARSIPGFHIYEALKSCGDLLLRFGGHKYAAGLSINPDHIAEFRTRLQEVARAKLTVDDLTPKLQIDAEIELEDVDMSFIDAVDMFAPFGPQNMRPIFLTRNLNIAGQPYVVGRNHLKMRVKKGDREFEVIGFGFGEHANALSMGGVDVDMAYVVEANNFYEQPRIQLRIKDLRY
jgi:single-stranded-DNA-specific exonuclease